MSSLALLAAAEAGTLFTDDDSNPWATTWVITPGDHPQQAPTVITVALWEVGLLELGTPAGSGYRPWRLTWLGRGALHRMRRTQQPPGDNPPIGGPYR